MEAEAKAAPFVGFLLLVASHDTFLCFIVVQKLIENTHNIL